MYASGKNVFFLSLLLLTGCGGRYMKMGDVASVGAAGVTALAAYQVAPGEWTSTEKAGLAAGAGILALVAGKVIEGKIDADEAEAYLQGYNIGVAQGARQQFEITMNLQKATEGRQQPRIKTYELPAPVKGDANYTLQNIYLEAAE